MEFRSEKLRIEFTAGREYGADNDAFSAAIPLTRRPFAGYFVAAS
jgi:hypothetical protein